MSRKNPKQEDYVTAQEIWNVILVDVRFAVLLHAYNQIDYYPNCETIVFLVSCVFCVCVFHLIFLCIFCSYSSLWLILCWFWVGSCILNWNTSWGICLFFFHIFIFTATYISFFFLLITKSLVSSFSFSFNYYYYYYTTKRKMCMTLTKTEKDQQRRVFFSYPHHALTNYFLSQWKKLSKKKKRRNIEWMPKYYYDIVHIPMIFKKKCEFLMKNSLKKLH